MLTSGQKRVVGLCAAGAGLLILLLSILAPRPVPRQPVTPLAPEFDGASALQYTRVLSEVFPDRVTGTPGSRRAGEYLRAEFRKLGYRVDSPTFSMWLGGERVQGENIVAQAGGESPESIAVIAHYDGQLTSHQAAEDNASGVGVLLELARVLRPRAHHRGLLFVATDAEEWGMIGARQLANFFKSRRTVAAISIDYLNAGPAPALEINCAGQFGGYTPLWLRDLMVAAGEAQHVRIEQATGFWEWIERTTEVSAQDQGPLLRAGIPALNVATLTKQVEASRTRYHTFDDVFRGFDPASFKMLGATVEQVVSALDSLPLPVSRREGMGDFCVSPTRYLPGPVVWLMQLLGILPAILAAIFAAQNLKAHELESLGWRLLGPMTWIIPPGLAALALYALTAANILKRYELYPATPKDPFLYQLPAQVLIPLLLVLVGGFVGLRKLRARVEIVPTAPGASNIMEAQGSRPAGPPLRQVGIPPEPFAIRKTILYLLVAATVVGAFALNPYAVGFYLGGFAYGTLLLLPPSRPAARALDAALLLAASLPLIALLYFFGQEIYLGWRILWYLVLQAAYGVWSPAAVALFLLSVVLWIQLFRLCVVASE
jgi:alkaline phosphatase isozyme conversion protein